MGGDIKTILKIASEDDTLLAFLTD